MQVFTGIRKTDLYSLVGFRRYGILKCSSASSLPFL